MTPELFQLQLRVAVERGRTRQALRPEGERTIRPDVDFLDVADRAGEQILLPSARLVLRMALVAHLRDDLHFGGLLREVPGLVHGPAQRLLHVHVLAERHCRRRDHRMHVVGRGDDDGVDVLLLVEHLAIVAIGLDLRQLLVDEFLDAIADSGVCVHFSLAASCAFDFPKSFQRRLRTSSADGSRLAPAPPPPPPGGLGGSAAVSCHFFSRPSSRLKSQSQIATMFSDITWAVLLPPMPLMPTTAMFRRSLGAWKPRPSTDLGTIMKPAAAAAVVVTNSRREGLFSLLTLEALDGEVLSSM